MGSVARKFGLPRPALSIVRSAWLDAKLVELVFKLERAELRELAVVDSGLRRLHIANDLVHLQTSFQASTGTGEFRVEEGDRTSGDIDRRLCQAPTAATGMAWIAWIGGSTSPFGSKGSKSEVRRFPARLAERIESEGDGDEDGAAHQQDADIDRRTARADLVGGMKLKASAINAPSKPTIPTNHMPKFPPGILNGRGLFGCV